MKAKLIAALAVLACASFGVAHATSFDCAKANTPADHLICNDPQLSAMDDQLFTLYEKVKSETPNKAALIANEKSAWINREENCSNKMCLIAWYESRLAYLSGLNTNLYAASVGAKVYSVPVAPAPQLYIAKPDGTTIACADEKITAELHDVLTREGNNPYLSQNLGAQLFSEGNCIFVSGRFRVMQKVVLRVPAGPQNLVEIAIPNAAIPGAPLEISWMMAADIEPATH